MKKTVFLIIQSVFCVLTAIMLIVADLIVYFEGVEEKSSDPMASIYSADAIADNAVFVIPVLVVSAIVTIVCVILKVRDEKAARPLGNIDIKQNTEENTMSASAVNIIRVVLLVVAVIFIVIGIFNGSLTDVFVKAAKICTECIGLG